MTVEFHSRLAASGPSVLDTLCGRDRAGDDDSDLTAKEDENDEDADRALWSLFESLSANLTECCCCGAFECCDAECTVAPSSREPSAIIGA